MSRKDQKCTIDGCQNRQHAGGWCRKHYMRWWSTGDATAVKFVRAANGEPLAFLDGIPLVGEGCHRWPYATNGAGYAQIKVHGKNELVSRIVCERANGPPPSPSHQAAHTCGNGKEACVAPWHLVWKTPAENNHDMDGHGTRVRGERHSKAGLTWADVEDIRRRALTESQSAIAARYGVAQSTISHIVTGRTWNVAP